MKNWFQSLDTAIVSMSLLRVVSGSTELLAAFFILYFNDVKKALVINGFLASIGPVILIASISIGLISLSGELSMSKFLFIGSGLTLLFIGIFK